MNDEVIRFAGDVSIEKIELISANGFGQEITNQVIAIGIYEDLFSPFISGVIAVKDSLDFINLFPLVGEEYVNIKVHTPSFQGEGLAIDDQYVVYKLTNRVQTGDRNMVYELHFISREALVDMNKKISKAYEGKVSDIANTIIKDTTYGLESKKKVNIEETPNGTKYVSNFWSPVKNLNYLSENAKTIEGSPNYLFFENRDGFNFLSINKLNGQGFVQEFVYDSFRREINANCSSKRDVSEEYKRITTIEIPTLYDYIDRSSSGMFASQQLSYDMLTKQYKVRNYDMLDDWSNHVHLNEYPPVSSNNIVRPSQLLMNSKNYYANFNGYTDTTNNSFSQKRLSLLKQMESTKINITVPGRTDYTVGDKVKVLLNKFNPIKKADLDTDITDNIFSGYYLISSINHQIDRERHECYMELIKDSVLVDLDKGGVR